MRMSSTNAYTYVNKLVKGGDYMLNRIYLIHEGFIPHSNNLLLSSSTASSSISFSKM